jgi:hypothetical protein
MNPLEPNSALLFDYLYGLLEGDQLSQVEELLQTSPQWQQALAEAQARQEILKLAARHNFDGVSFQEPQEAAATQDKVVLSTPATASPARLATPAATTPAPETIRLHRAEKRHVLRWALAASLLFGLLGAGALGGWNLINRYQSLSASQDRLAQLNKERSQATNLYQGLETQARQDVEDLQERIKKLEAKWKGEKDQVIEEAQSKQIQVTVTGPKTFQAGARNQYQISTHKLENNRGLIPTPSTVEVQVIDPDANTNEPVFKKTLENKNGTIQVDLPLDLPVTPGKRLQLQVAALSDAGVKASVEEPLPLVGQLFLTHLTTDRPVYRPGEEVRFRSLTLDRFTLQPPKQNLELIFTIEDKLNAQIFNLPGTTHIKNGDQDNASLLKGPDGEPIRGIGAGEFTLPPGLSGGVYTLKVREVNGKFPEEKRTFLVNNYQPPRLNMEVEFHRKSYGPGEEVIVKSKVARVDGNASIPNQPVLATATVDGQQVGPVVTVKTDAKGNVPDIRFTLPKTMTRGEGSVALQFTDGASLEPKVKPLPIVLDKLAVDFFPEGGDLVAGVPNRVYFRVRTTTDRPAELTGRIVDKAGKVITQVQTVNDDNKAGVNQGLGLFAFTPEANNSYELKIDTPIGIKGQYVLPLPRADGVVLSVRDGVVTDKIQVDVQNTGDERKLLVGAYCRGHLMDHTTQTVPSGKNANISLTPAKGVGGVYRITVFEEKKLENRSDWLPLAERLIYCRADRQLELNVESDKTSYVPGDRVKLKVTSLNEQEKSTPAIVLLSVVDQSVIKMIDDKTERAMPTHFYLTTEVEKAEDLEYADFLVSADPMAEVALDLLLGTQGWRRFIEQDPKLSGRLGGQDKKGVNQQQDVQRLLAVNGLAQPDEKKLVEHAHNRIDAKFAPAWIDDQTVLAKLEQTFPAKVETIQTQRMEKLTLIDTSISEAQGEEQRAEQELREFGFFLIQAVMFTLGVMLLLIAVAGVVLAAVYQSSQPQRSRVCLFAGLCCLLLLLVAGIPSALWVSHEMGRFGDDRLVMKQSAIATTPAQVGGPGAVALAEMEARDGADNAAEKADDMKAEIFANKGKFMADPKKAFAPEPKNAAPPPPKADPADANFNAPALAPVPVAPMNQVAARPAAAMPPGAPFANKKEDGFRLAKKPPQRAGFGGAMPPMLEPMADLKMPMMDRIQAGQGGFGFGERAMGGMAPDGLELEKHLRQNGQLEQLARLKLGIVGGKQRQVALPAPPQPFIVREYAHHNKRDLDAIRRDFAETLYWHPALVLKDGKAEVAFDLSDSITSFRVQVWGHSMDGRLGATHDEIVSRLPFSVEPKVPVEVSHTDKITIPVAVANTTSSPRKVELTAAAANLKIIGPDRKTFDLGADQRLRQLFQFQPTVTNGEAKLIFEGQSNPFKPDTVERTFRIVPEGFPIVGSKSDLLEEVASHIVTLPKTWVNGSLNLQVQAFPSTLADLQKGLEGMLREPNGCFEQTSSSNYPNIMILSYLKESEQSSPKIEQTARDLIDRGYQKLISFECIDPVNLTKKEGYEWFGQTAPPHEALTAYGLLQFRDLAKVYPNVDQAMLERTQKYLLDQRDGKGGFKRNTRALDSFGRAPDHITNAYIVWALTDSGTRADLAKELNALKIRARDSQDPYFMSLTALGLLNSGERQEAVDILKKLRDLQKDEGFLAGAETSITASSGRTLEIETTGLAVLAWLKANQPADFHPNVQKATKWIGQQRGGSGQFGSTQSTILALKALIAYTRENRKTAEAGTLKLFINDRLADTLDFPAGCQEELIVKVPAREISLLKSGDNKVRVEVSGKNSFPHTLTWTYNTLQPATQKDTPVFLDTQLSRTSVKEGETVQLTAVVKNMTGKGQGMTVAVLGLPAGLNVPDDMKQLKEMTRLQDKGTKPGKISAFEIRGRELVLYWRDLAPGQQIEVSLDLVCRIPGEFRGPASRAYLYYDADQKFWTNPLAITITSE